MVFVKHWKWDKIVQSIKVFVVFSIKECPSINRIAMPVKSRPETFSYHYNVNKRKKRKDPRYPIGLVGSHANANKFLVCICMSIPLLLLVLTHVLLALYKHALPNRTCSGLDRYIVLAGRVIGRGRRYGCLFWEGRG